MPELPEVETVVRQLRSKVVNKTITELKILDKKVIDKKLKKILPAKIENIQRRGKAIILNLNKGNLLVQLRMTGHFYHVKNEKDAEKYLAGSLKLDDNSYLTYNTIRRFGSVQFLTNKQLQQKLSTLGPEPLEINSKIFSKIFKKYPRANLKNKLLDQSVIAGIGNIYAQEALYHCQINPNKTIHQISNKQLIKLHQEIQRILKLAIKNNGTTVDNYSHLDGKGDFQNFLTVYNQSKCPKKHKIEKINIAGRGTSFCLRCQPE
jgi:formamidopyrimidine-DNA glycosylase